MAEGIFILTQKQLFLLRIAKRRGLTLSDIARTYDQEVTWNNKFLWYKKAQMLEEMEVLRRGAHKWYITSSGTEYIETGMKK